MLIYKHIFCFPRTEMFQKVSRQEQFEMQSQKGDAADLTTYIQLSGNIFKITGLQKNGIKERVSEMKHQETFVFTEV